MKFEFFKNSVLTVNFIIFTFTADDFDEEEIEEQPEPQHDDDRLGNILNMGDDEDNDAYLHSEDYY